MNAYTDFWESTLAKQSLNFQRVFCIKMFGFGVVFGNIVNRKQSKQPTGGVFKEMQATSISQNFVAVKTCF